MPVSHINFIEELLGKMSGKYLMYGIVCGPYGYADTASTSFPLAHDLYDHQTLVNP